MEQKGRSYIHTVLLIKFKANQCYYTLNDIVESTGNNTSSDAISNNILGVDKITVTTGNINNGEITCLASDDLLTR